MTHVAPADVPNACPSCAQMTLHRPAPDGRLYCLPCMMRPPQPALHQQVGHAQQPKVLIEMTAKKWKTASATGSAFVGIGLVVAMEANGTAGGVMLFVGIVVLIYARIGAWWHHG